MLRREGGLAVAVLEPEQDDSAADTDSSVEE
jgi:hypothetical protein